MPVRVTVSIACAGEAVDFGPVIYEVLGRHGLAPQSISTVDEDRIPISGPTDFVSNWAIQRDVLMPEDGSIRRQTYGSEWSRRTAPQGWGRIAHRLTNTKGRVKLGRVTLDHTYSPKVDWKAAFIDLCTAINPLEGTLDVFRPKTSGALGYVMGYPLFATDSPPANDTLPQVDAAPWGTLNRMAWGLWLGDAWTDDRRGAFAEHMIESDGLLHLTDQVPKDPETLTGQKAAIVATCPHLFNAHPRYQGFP